MYSSFSSNFNMAQSLYKNHLTKYPSPASLSYAWNFGFASLIFLFIQIISGILLAMHYCSDVSLAFISVEHIMRDVNYGWFFRYMHANGASFFFICVYVHMFRGIFYKSFFFVNFKVWISGVLLFFLMMGTAFIGYVLPWGQMSFWGATVITNMASAIPWIGNSVVLWIWGGFSVGAPTLSRFFSIHYVLPFVILLMAIIHMAFLHEKGSSNPFSVAPQINRLFLPLYPYFAIKDLFGFSIIFMIFIYFISFQPDILGHSDNYIEADPLSTPAHIVPEWYFLPFYAILRSIDNKISGVVAMILAILMYLKLPYFSSVLYRLRLVKFSSSFFFRRWFNPICSVWFANLMLILGWLGAKPVETPFVELGSLLVCLYFFIFPVFFFICPAVFSYISHSEFFLNSKLYSSNNISSKVNNKVFYEKKDHVEFLFKNSTVSSITVFECISSTEVLPTNLNTLSIFAFSSIFLILLLLSLSLILSNSVFLNSVSNFNKPFECGFSPFLINPSIKISIHAFRIALIFLLFDLEILYILPWVYSVKHFLIAKLFFFPLCIIPFFFILFVGILYEYSVSLTDWRAFYI